VFFSNSRTYFKVITSEFIMQFANGQINNILNLAMIELCNKSQVIDQALKLICEYS